MLKVNREKVLKGLDCCSQMNGLVCRTECPYHDECLENECVGAAHLCANALELFKEYNERIAFLERALDSAAREIGKVESR